MRVPFARSALLTLLLLGTACAGHRKSDGKPRADREVITREQIRTNRFTSAWDAVEALHSIWLQTRGTDSFNSPTAVWVYLDENRLGGVQTLKDIPIANISYIRHYDGLTATGRWGVGHGQGVIYVSSQLR
jgi:hypothetical protein